MSENENVQETQQTPVKYTVSPEARRQLHILMSDLRAAKASFENDIDYYAALGRLSDQMEGIIPFESAIGNYKKVAIVKDAKEPTTVAYFYTSARYRREGKLILNQSLQLVYYPIGKNLDKGEIYFPVKDVTKQAAMQVFEANRNVFTQIEFLSDRLQAARALRNSTKPAAARVKRKKNIPVITTAEDAFAEVADEIIEENIVPVEQESVQEVPQVVDETVDDVIEFSAQEDDNELLIAEELLDEAEDDLLLLDA